MLAVVFAAIPAHAVGYFNVPGNVAQWWGYGWGAGHHACFVLGPISHKGSFAHNHVRLRHVPQPAYGCYPECNYNYDFRQPLPPDANQLPPGVHTLTPNTMPMPELAPEPEEMFPSPVER
jgi:hypothetical protein